MFPPAARQEETLPEERPGLGRPPSSVLHP